MKQSKPAIVAENVESRHDSLKDEDHSDSESTDSLVPERTASIIKVLAG